MDKVKKTLKARGDDDFHAFWAAGEADVRLIG